MEYESDVLSPLGLALVCQLTGTVVDANAGSAIAGARVKVRASEDVVIADGAGRFSLPVSTSTAVIAAASVGYYTGSSTVSAGDITIRLEPLPVDDAAYQTVAPRVCRECHPAQVEEWNASALANAGVNPWVFDVYDGTGTSGGMGGFVYTRDSVHAAGNPSAECGACHQPEIWLTQPYSAMQDTLTGGTGALHGVSCDICHKIALVDTTRLHYPGVHPDAVTMARPPPGTQVQFGVLGDTTFREPGEMRSSYQPQLVAEVCATCHQDKNDPDQDGDFEEDNGVVSEPTYLEWKRSEYADPDSARFATCVDCHMPPTNRTRACSMQNPPVDRPTTQVRSHRFEGTSQAFLEKALTSTASIEVSQDELRITVSLTNTGAGHHVPTGVSIRNMVLLVEATTADGASLAFTGDQVLAAEAGVGDPANGYFAGLAGKLYAKSSAGADGTAPVFFTDAVRVASDTRLPALVTDTTEYRFGRPMNAAEVTVRVRVIYRRAWRALVDAKGWTTTGYGAPLDDIAPPHFGALMREHTLRATVPALPLSPPSTTAPPDVMSESSCSCRSVSPVGFNRTVVPWLLALLLGLAQRKAWLPKRRHAT